MDTEAVAACIETYLAGHGQGPVPGRDENLFVSGSLDSMGIMRLIAFLEDHYRFKIPPADLVPEHFKTIAAMSAYLAGAVPPG